jgi:hypothetical protein
MCDALKAKGASVVFCDPLTYSSIDELASFIRAEKPSFCLAQNDYSFDPLHPLLSDLYRFLQSENIPTVCWYVDDPSLSGSFGSVAKMWTPPFPKNFYYFYPDRTYAEFFSARGLPASQLLSAADSNLQAYTPKAPQYDLSLVARPSLSTEKSLLTLGDIQKEAADIFFSIFERLVTSTQIFKKFLAEGVRHESLRDALFDRFNSHILSYFIPAYESHPQYLESRNNLCGFISSFSPPDSSRLQLLLTGPADQLYSACELLSYVSRLQSRGLKLFGGDIWKKFFPNLSDEPKYLEPSDLYDVYGSSRINFCYTKRQFPTAVVERPLHILAAGGFPLTDYRSDLEVLFEKDEIISYGSIEEAESLIDYYLRNERARAEIVEKGRKKVFASHTYAHRATKF